MANIEIAIQGKKNKQPHKCRDLRYNRSLEAQMGDQKLLTRDSKDSDDINGCSEEDALLLEK